MGCLEFWTLFLDEVPFDVDYHGKHEVYKGLS